MRRPGRGGFPMRCYSSTDAKAASRHLKLIMALTTRPSETAHRSADAARQLLRSAGGHYHAVLHVGRADIAERRADPVRAARLQPEDCASMLIQTAFFSGYFVFSIPAASIIDWIGYKRAILVGLGIMVVALPDVLSGREDCRRSASSWRRSSCWPSASPLCRLRRIHSLRCSAMPKTASSRLNLTQAFNSLGTDDLSMDGRCTSSWAAAVSYIADQARLQQMPTP